MAQFNSFPDQKTNTNLSRYVSDITYKNCFKILLKKYSPPEITVE